MMLCMRVPVSGTMNAFVAYSAVNIHASPLAQLRGCLAGKGESRATQICFGGGRKPEFQTFPCLCFHSKTCLELCLCYSQRHMRSFGAMVCDPLFWHQNCLTCANLAPSASLDGCAVAPPPRTRKVAPERPPITASRLQAWACASFSSAVGFILSS